LGLEGLKLLRAAADEFGLLVISEVTAQDQIAEARRSADILQVGTRNMHNYPLLTALGASGHPVLLKRGFGSTIAEWIAAAQYVLKQGNERVLLCERGIRTFEPATRFTLDVAAVPIAKRALGLPVLVDPSHAAGDRQWVEPLALAGLGAGADGLLVEVHPDPGQALSDGPQSLTPEQLPGFVSHCRAVAQALGRTL